MVAVHTSAVPAWVVPEDCNTWVVQLAWLVPAWLVLEDCNRWVVPQASVVLGTVAVVDTVGVVLHHQYTSVVLLWPSRVGQWWP